MPCSAHCTPPLPTVRLHVSRSTVSCATIEYDSKVAQYIPQYAYILHHHCLQILYATNFLIENAFYLLVKTQACSGCKHVVGEGGVHRLSDTAITMGEGGVHRVSGITITMGEGGVHRVSGTTITMGKGGVHRVSGTWGEGGVHRVSGTTITMGGGRDP